MPADGAHSGAYESTNFNLEDLERNRYGSTPNKGLKPAKNPQMSIPQFLVRKKLKQQRENTLDIMSLPELRGAAATKSQQSVDGRDVAATASKDPKLVI